ncbi:alpha/beta fold hydrolase [Natronospora cellulosivora (SeqCode)]
MEEKIKKFQGKEVKLEYLLTGEDNEETIVFVHGAGLNLRQFLSQHEYFSNKYRVLSLSLRGHGNSQRPREETLEAFSMKKHANDFKELLEYLGIDRFHYVGNSAGGMLGYQLIAEKPEWFMTITTYGTAPEIRLRDWQIKLVVAMDKIMGKIMRKAYMKFMSNAITKHEHTRKQLLSLFMAGDKDTAWRFRSQLGNYSYLSVMKNINIPALIINGEWDKEIAKYLEAASKTIEKNPCFSLTILDDAGHVANIDKPIEFNQVVEEHIQKT